MKILSSMFSVATNLAEVIEIAAEQAKIDSQKSLNKAKEQAHNQAMSYELKELLKLDDRITAARNKRSQS